MITIVIHAYEICTENVIKLIVCLEPGRGGMPIEKIQLLQHIHRQISRPRLGRGHRSRLDQVAPQGSPQ